MKNSISFMVSGRNALFTDPITKVGGEKYSYQIPTYEAIKGILKSIYWKPTIVWYVDRIRVMKPIQTQARGVKPMFWANPKSKPPHTLSIYTYLRDVEYQVEAHFEWNLARPELKQDRIEGKHFSIAQRMVKKGGRLDPFLGVRDCQADVEPCIFGEGIGAYDNLEELSFGLMLHGIDYPDENPGTMDLVSRFWVPVMKKGIIEFIRPEECTVRKFVRTVSEIKQFNIGTNMTSVVAEEGMS
jgi:CRISPR-associated protein Cas5d